MATSISVNGKVIKRPGVYATTKSGIKRSPAGLPYGNIVIIDTGVGGGFIGGSGMRKFTLETPQDYQDFVKGGPLWDIAEALFDPAGTRGINGVSKVYVVRAATTTPSTITIPFGELSITMTTKDEGVGSNGETTAAGNLYKGYGVHVVKNPSGKYQLKFYHGTYRGADVLNNSHYAGLDQDASLPTLFLESAEFANTTELYQWFGKSADFKKGFNLTSTQPAQADVVDDAITTNIIKAVGGTETYDNDLINQACMLTDSSDNSFFLCVDGGDDATGIANTAIFSYLKNDSRFEKYMIVPGGYDYDTYKGTEVGSSEHAAKFFNSNLVQVVHGGSIKNTRLGSIVKGQLYKAAIYLGRLCGVAPAIPLTLKRINVDGEVHSLDGKDLDFALDNGIVASYYDEDLENVVILQAINTLQRNEFLVDEENGISFDVAVERIKAQLNRELIIAAKKNFFSNENGPNRGTISTSDLEAWTDGFLTSRISNVNNPGGLILNFKDIVATVEEDNYFVNYAFVPNYPVSKIVFSGTMLES